MDQENCQSFLTTPVGESSTIRLSDADDSTNQWRFFRQTSAKRSAHIVQSKSGGSPPMPRKAVKLPRVSETVLASPAAPALHTPAASATLERGRFLSESDDRGDHHAQHLRSRQRGLPLGAGAALRRVRRKVRFGLKLLFLIPALLCAFWVSGDARQRPLRRDSRPKLDLIACNPSRPNRAGLSPGRTAPGAAQAPPRFVPSRTLRFSPFAPCGVSRSSVCHLSTRRRRPRWRLISWVWRSTHHGSRVRARPAMPTSRRD